MRVANRVGFEHFGPGLLGLGLGCFCIWACGLIMGMLYFKKLDQTGPAYQAQSSWFLLVWAARPNSVRVRALWPDPESFAPNRVGPNLVIRPGSFKYIILLK